MTITRSAMDTVIAVVRPKQNVGGMDYRAKLYDILLLDHKNVDKPARLTKVLPVVKIPCDEEPRDGILSQLYADCGIKGRRALHVPWRRHHRADVTTRPSITMYCVPVSSRDKLADLVANAKFYPMDYVLEYPEADSTNFGSSTQTYVSHLESWLKEKHLKAGTIDIMFRERGDFRITLCVNNPSWIPLNMGLDSRTSSSAELQHIQLEANTSLAKLMEVDKCENVVINPLFGSGFVARKPKVNRVTEWLSLPPQDYSFESSATSCKSDTYSTAMTVNPDGFPLQQWEQYPLHYLATKGDMTQLYEHSSRDRPSLDKGDLNDWTPLHYAALYGHKEVVQMLLRSGCSPNVVNSDDRTPLHLAANKGYPAIVNILVKHPDVDLNVVDKKGRTALEMCDKKLSWEHIKAANLIETAAKQPRPIKVLMMDSTSKNLNLVDGANTTVAQLNQQMLREFNMPEMPYSDVFAIWICSKSLQLQMKPDQKPVECMKKWDKTIGGSTGMLKDRDQDFHEEDEGEPHLKWKRNAKISLIVEREVMHPDGVNLLFHEAKLNYINALYPCKELDVPVLASILLYMEHGGNLRTVEKVLSKSKNLTVLVPRPWLKSRFNWRSRIFQQYKLLSNTIAERERRSAEKVPMFQLQTDFLNHCRNLTVYGSAFFTGSIDGRPRIQCFIGVNDVGLHIINSRDRTVLCCFKYSEISWHLPPEYGVLDITVSQSGERQADQIKLRTGQAGWINHLMRKLFNIEYGVYAYGDTRSASQI